MRKNNPKLKEVVDEFVKTHAVGTSFGNTLVRRYLQKQSVGEESNHCGRNQEVRSHR